MSDIEPMTAAEARKLVVWPYGTSERILAALEERERLLGERAVLVDERDRARTEAAEVRRLTEGDAAEYRRGLYDGAYWAWFNNYAEHTGAKWDHEGYLSGEGGVFDTIVGVNSGNADEPSVPAATALITADEVDAIAANLTTHKRGRRDRYARIAATLRHHEANADDAALGALVRRIREHPMVQRAGSTALLLTAHGNDGRDSWQPHFDGLTACLSHLDSLLPKEPEVVTGPSGKAYRVRDGVVEHLAIYPVNRDPSHYSPPSAWERLEIVTLSDAPVVAALMAKGGKDGE